MTSLVTPTELKKLADEIEERKAHEAIEKMRKLDADQQGMHEAFMERELNPDVTERLSAAVRRAAQSGQHEIQVLKFPATWTNDRGRRINNAENDWPVSLEGFAKRAYEYYAKELKPAGYVLRAQVMSYNDGVPGEIAMHLGW